MNADILIESIDRIEGFIATMPRADPRRPGMLQALSLALELRFQRTRSRADLDRAILIAEEAVFTTPSSDPDKGKTFWTLSLLQRSRFELTDAAEDLDGMIRAMDEAVHSTMVNHADRPDYVIRLGEALFDRYERTQSKEDLDRAIALKREALPLLPADHPERSCCLDMLGNAYNARYSRDHAREDLDHAVEFKEQAVSSLAADDPERARYLTNLYNALDQRFEISGVIEDLNRSIEYMQEAVNVTRVGDPLQERRLLCLSSSFSNRYKLTRSIGDIDKAVNTARIANTLALHDDRPPLGLNTLVVALLSRFQQSGSKTDSDEAIDILNNILLNGASQDVANLNTLGCALLRRFERFGSPEDLNLAIDAFVAAIDSTSHADPNRLTRLNNLVLGCEYRFTCTRKMKDLDNALHKAEEAVKEPGKCTTRATALMNFGNLLRHRFGQTNSMEDINRAIGMLKESLDLIPDDSSSQLQRAKRLHHLGQAHQALFKQRGSVSDLAHAIDASETALDLMPADHPDLPAALHGLSLAYRARFIQTGSGRDLDKAIFLHEQEGALVPEDHPNRARFLTNLSVALENRFVATGSLEDITRAISTAEDALKVTSQEDPERETRLSIQGGLLLSRYQTTHTPDDLQQCITIMEDALRQQSKDDFLTLSNLNNMSLSLSFRYKNTKSMTDLDRAIELAQKSVQGAPRDYPEKAWFLNTLSHALVTRFKQTGKQEDLDQAAAAAEDAVNLISASPTTRITDAFEIADRLANIKPAYAAHLYKLAVKLLPTVSPRTIDPVDQQNNLSKFAGRPSTAAAFALQQGESNFEALALLEIGRGVLANMKLELRSDVSVLQEEHPELAKRFTNLRDTLDPPDRSMRVTADRNEALGHTLRSADAIKFESIIKEIRSLKGFERFLLGPMESEVLDLASHAPIIVLNAANRRCDAFVISPTGIDVIPLPQLKYEDIPEHANALHGAIHDTSVRSYSASMKKLKKCLEWLWDVAVGPIMDEIGFNDIPHKSGCWPRVWWMPTGLLSVFPWHAAGRHASGSSTSTIDRVVSSYTPTLKALSYMREKAQKATANYQKATFVAMSATENQSTLPSADAEVQRVFDLLPSSISKVMLDKPTKEEVLREIRTSNIMHFACHGELSPLEPSQSRLFLRDWQTNPLTVADLTALRLDNPRFAYLSACHAAANRSLLFEEAIHLAGACYLAGFTHIVGTLWHIYDMQSAAIAVEVYSFMLDREGRLDLTKSAEGLHHAVRRLRDRTRDVQDVQRKQPDDPIVWASYIHIGV